MLDLCTGSGCIALALAHHLPGVDVLAIDVQAHATILAERNRMRQSRSSLHVASPMAASVMPQEFATRRREAVWHPAWWAWEPLGLLQPPASVAWARSWVARSQARAVTAFSTVSVVLGDIFDEAMLDVGPVDLVRVLCCC